MLAFVGFYGKICVRFVGILLGVMDTNRSNIRIVCMIIVLSYTLHLFCLSFQVSRPKISGQNAFILFIYIS